MADEEILRLILNKLDNLESDMGSVKTEVSDIKATMATKEELTATNVEIASLKTEVGDIKANMTTKPDLADLKDDITSNVLSLVTDNLLPAMEAMEERLSEQIDDISDRLFTVEVISGQNYTNIAKLRRTK